MMVQMNLSWRLRRLDRWHITDLKDISNAFHSTGHDHLVRAADDLLTAEHVDLGVERFKWATVVVPGSKGPLTVHPRCGALIGDPFAVALFCTDINGPFGSSWNKYKDTVPGADCLVSEVAELGIAVDMGFQCYVDDGVAKIVGEPGTGVVGLCDRSRQFDSIFAAELALHNYTANPTKNESVVSIFGEDSQRHARALLQDKVRPAGKVCVEARYLGGRLHGLLDARGEVAMRISAIKQGFHSLGEFWFTKGVSRRARRAALLATVVNAACAGMEAYVLEERHVQRTYLAYYCAEHCGCWRLRMRLPRSLRQPFHASLVVRRNCER